MGSNAATAAAAASAWPPEPIDRALARLAARQHGLFTRGQAVMAGASNHLIHRRLAAGR
ncbi:MAG: type IV toxin-antitoxin system AbiEi family antitoxin domain-containing protein [bacterium]